MGYRADRLLRLAKGFTGRADLVILMYHRVAEPSADPWGLAVSPERFAAQMRVLKRLRRPVALDEMAAKAVAGTPEPGTVAITFDDAYRDVLANAKPILEELGIPATVFVVTGELGNERGFWWDRLAGAIVSGDPPEELPGFSFCSEEDLRRVQKKWRKGGHRALRLALWTVIRPLPSEAREAAVDEVAASFRSSGMVDAPIMTADEIDQLIAGGLITIGAHTVTHPTLPSLSAQEQLDEIRIGREALERLIGAPINRLAYPFGDYDERSLVIARELGFDYAVSVDIGSVRGAAERFRLPRHDVKNWSQVEFRRRLRWLM